MTNTRIEALSLEEQEQDRGHVLRCSSCPGNRSAAGMIAEVSFTGL